MMPYLSIKSQANLAGFTFVPNEKLNHYISDQSLKNHIQSIFAMYKSPSGAKIKNPTLITYSGTKFSDPRQKTLDKLHDVKSALLFSAFLKTNSWSIATSDNFDIVNQRFNVGDDGLALQGGSIHGISVGGLKISTTTFTTSPNIHVPTMYHSFEPEVLSGLIQCVQQRETNSICSTVLRSLRSFGMAYRNSFETDSAQRVLSMITAFELLFGGSSRSTFRNSILRYSEEYNPTFRTYPEMHTQTGSLIRNRSLSGTQIWAEEFYKLRHRIIHSDLVTFDDYIFTDLNGVFSNHNNHVAIAFEIYAVCLVNFLRENGFINNYHLRVSERIQYSTTDRNFMNIQNREFFIIDQGLHDLLSSLTI